MSKSGYLVLETGHVFSGLWHGGLERAGEVVFNTSHSGYEEIATDPSYFSQIMVMTAPMQGNYGVADDAWESGKMWIEGFVCLSLQDSPSPSESWRQRLIDHSIPILSEVDTRKLVLHLRENGTTWGALVEAESESQATSRAHNLIAEKKQQNSDWVYAVSRQEYEDVRGDNPNGPKVAIIDYGCKANIVRELKRRCREIRVFPARTKAEEIKKWEPDGILLSNGPGDPALVKQSTDAVADLLGWRFVFGICMGHQILARALGAQTYKLKFGHRGSNHPVKDHILNKIYVTSQNHGYAVEHDSLPKGTQVTHTNLNDNTVAGIYHPEKKCLAVQFHPESHPGPHDAETLFDFFVKQMQ